VRSRYHERRRLIRAQNLKRKRERLASAILRYLPCVREDKEEKEGEIT